MGNRITLQDIIDELTPLKWKVLSDSYTNLTTEMTFECPEGHRVYATWKKLRGKCECPTCATNGFSVQDNEIRTKPANTYRILALDQASHVTGYSIFDNGELIKYGTFQTELDDEIARSSLIKSWLLSMINNWRPDHIGLEGIQYQDEGSGRKMGVTVFQTLARLQGILMETCYSCKIPYTVCPTNTWRHVCGVKGTARTDRKRSMQLLVKQWYDISVTDDESDAIGIGHYLTMLVNKNTQVENWET